MGKQTTKKTKQVERTIEDGKLYVIEPSKEIKAHLGTMEFISHELMNQIRDAIKATKEKRDKPLSEDEYSDIIAVFTFGRAERIINHLSGKQTADSRQQTEGSYRAKWLSDVIEAATGLLELGKYSEVIHNDLSTGRISQNEFKDLMEKLDKKYAALGVFDGN